MKKILLMLFCLFIASSISFADDYDFRQVNWGMTREEVMQAEGDLAPVKTFSIPFYKFHVPKENLAYDITLFDKKTSLQYEFINNQLIMGYYIFYTIPTDKESNLIKPYSYYLDQYTLLKNALSQKYGPPKEIETWANETYKNDPASLGEHLINNHLTIKSIWETERTVIVLNCFELLREYKFYRNRIIYYDREYYQTLSQIEPAKEADLKDL